MAQFDVHRLPDGVLVIDIQSDLIHVGATRVVLPLVVEDDAGIAIARLQPIVEIDGRRLVVATHLIAAVRSALLSDPIESLAADEHRIKAALDMLISGY